MIIRSSRKGDTAILHLTDKSEYGDEKRLSDAALAALEEAPSVLAVDVSGVDYVNSMGIAALFSIMKSADEMNCDFVIYGMNHTVSVILEKVLESDLVPLLSEEEFKRKYLS